MAVLSHAGRRVSRINALAGATPPWQTRAMARLSRFFALAGTVLLAAGLLLWWLARPDLALHLALRAPPGSTAERLAGLLAIVGGLPVLGLVAAIVAIGLALRRRGREALWLGVTITLGRLLVEACKELVRRPRPPLADRLAHVTSWSFPSSHSAGAVMTLLALALLAGGRDRTLAAALALTAAVGWSRVALAVHWPSDVLAGWACGFLWIALAMRWLDDPPRHRSTGAVGR